jgi:hypothetical protein
MVRSLIQHIVQITYLIEEIREEIGVESVESLNKVLEINPVIK